LTRIIPGFKKLSYEERLRKLDLWTLEERRNRADLLQVFKMYKGLSTTPFSNLLLSVLLVMLVDILPRLRKVDASWI